MSLDATALVIRYGRCSELDRTTSHMRLNQKRSDAQVSHGRFTKVREARLATLRATTQRARRAVSISLALDLRVPAVAAGGERIAIVGPNGTGKTTMLRRMLEDFVNAGVIAQGGSDWMLEDSLAALVPGIDLTAHRFPAALAERPLASLSPGERARRAHLPFQQRPTGRHARARRADLQSGPRRPARAHEGASRVARRSGRGEPRSRIPREIGVDR